jgi:hypothetical protein
MNAYATVLIVYATMCAFLSCFGICIVKHMLAWVKRTKCHPPLLALLAFTLVSDNKDKNKQNIKSQAPAFSFHISEGNFSHDCQHS